MNANTRHAVTRPMLFVFGLITSIASYASHGHDGGHYHGHDRGYQYHGGHHHGGGIYFGGGWGPNIIINVPTERYYPLQCEVVEICDEAIDECWLERECH